MKHPHFRDIKNEFCEVKRNHVAFSPARKTHSISVLSLISLWGNEPCPLVLRYGFLHHLPRTLKKNHRNGISPWRLVLFRGMCYIHIFAKKIEWEIKS